jgi:hypothetical protein
MDANITVEIAGIIINVILIGVNMWWQSVLNKRKIQATLLAAQPEASINKTRKPRKKVFGPKQRHALKILRLLRLFAIGSLLGLSHQSAIFLYLVERNIYIDSTVVISFAFGMIIGIRGLVMIRRKKREVESGNRAAINELCKSFPPR